MQVVIEAQIARARVDELSFLTRIATQTGLSFDVGSWVGDPQHIEVGCTHLICLSLHVHDHDYRLDDEVKHRLDHLAEATQRSKSFLAAEAIRAFVESNEWQIGDVQAALGEG